MTAIVIVVVTIIGIGVRCEETSIMLSYKLGDCPTQGDQSVDTTPTFLRQPSLLRNKTGGMSAVAGTRRD